MGSVGEISQSSNAIAGPWGNGRRGELLPGWIGWIDDLNPLAMCHEQVWCFVYRYMSCVSNIPVRTNRTKFVQMA